MYHFTSGRQDFDQMPDDSAEAVRKILEIKLKDLNHLQQLPVMDLQKTMS